MESNEAITDSVLLGVLVVCFIGTTWMLEYVFGPIGVAIWVGLIVCDWMRQRQQ